ncbi:MAG: zinc ribbon domain-containing protein [Romboutsia sp.]
MVKCPRCGKEVSSRPGTICPRCGLKVSEVNQKIRCPEASCRELVSKKLEYCPKCGCKLKGYKFSELMRMARSKLDETFYDNE